LLLGCVSIPEFTPWSTSNLAAEEVCYIFMDGWHSRVRCKAVVSSFEAAGEELFTFLQFPQSQWKVLRTTNALECINEKFRRRTKVQASLPGEDAVLLLLYGCCTVAR
jgi:transposase-like protein